MGCLLIQRSLAPDSKMQLLKAEPIYTMAQGHGSILGSVSALYNHCTNDTLEVTYTVWKAIFVYKFLD